MSDYNDLKRDYDIFECPYLREDNIKEYFKDNGRQFFDCGRGYYQESASFLARIEDKFFAIVIGVSIDSTRMDVGDRMYFVDDILSVEYAEIPKPEPKPRYRVRFDYELSKSELTRVNKLLTELGLNKLSILDDSKF